VDDLRSGPSVAPAIRLQLLAQPLHGSDGMIVRVDVYQDGESLIVAAELPGVRPGEIEIEATSRALRIRGTRGGGDRADAGARIYHRRECLDGHFLRDVPLPLRVRTEGVEATLQEGFLVVRLPIEKSPKEPDPLRVPIGGGVRVEDPAGGSPGTG
jgi:HSP20 family protein